MLRAGVSVGEAGLVRAGRGGSGGGEGEISQDEEQR